MRAQAQAVLAAARRCPAPDPKGTEDESVLVNRLHEIGVGDLLTIVGVDIMSCAMQMTAI